MLLMRDSKKIAAFTLSEVLVVLVITSIVMAIAFSVLRLVTQQYTAINVRYKERTEIQKLKQRLISDLDKAYQVSWDDTEQQLYIDGGEGVAINYEWTEGYLLRNTDTLSDKTAAIRLFYLGNEVKEGMIDGLEIELIPSGQPIRLFVSRKLDARQKLSDLWD
jgi:prepilin-type N-terminal cleavage/methylation domain-containing protein